MGKDEAQGQRQKSERMKGAGAKNVKSVHKYRGPSHITTVTGPLILTPAVLVTMDTSQLGPLQSPSRPMAFHWGTWPEAVIMGLSEASVAPRCHDVNIYIQSAKGLQLEASFI